MKLPGIDLDELKNEDGFYNEKQRDALELLYGEPLKKLEERASNKPPVPEGSPTKDWSRDTKLKFIEEHGKDEYKRLINERK